MEALIVSDSHGRSHNVNQAIAKQIKRPGMLLFLGDGLRDLDQIEPANQLPLYAVKGNCDVFEWYSEHPTPEEMLVAIEGHVALLSHGARYGVKSGTGALIASAARQGADLVLYGHTHVPHLERIEEGAEIGGVILPRPMYVFNPGSIGYDGSFGTLTLRGNEVLFSHGKL